MQSIQRSLSRKQWRCFRNYGVMFTAQQFQCPERQEEGARIAFGCECFSSCSCGNKINRPCEKRHGNKYHRNVYLKKFLLSVKKNNNRITKKKGELIFFGATEAVSGSEKKAMVTHHYQCIIVPRKHSSRAFGFSQHWYRLVCMTNQLIKATRWRNRKYCDDCFETIATIWSDER